MLLFDPKQAAKQFAKAMHSRSLALQLRAASLTELLKLAGEVQAGPVTVTMQRTPRRPSLLDGRLSNTRPIERTARFERLDAPTTRRVQKLLVNAYPKLNRAERRHLARGHRWMFLAEA